MSLVSVIIPVYGVEKYIAAAVQSVIDQTYRDWELLIIDDASPDRSIEICRQFLDPRIKIVCQANRGLAGARNTGIRYAVGEYIAFLDGDDVWFPEKLEKHVAHLQAHSQTGVSFSRSVFIDEAGKSFGNYQMPQLSGISSAYLLRCNPVGNGSAAVVRRSALDAIKFTANVYGTTEDFYFDEHFRRSEDIECWLRISLQSTWQINGLPEVLTMYRVNSAGLSASLLPQLASWEQMIEKTRSYAPSLIAQSAKQARSYQLRYLARSALRLQAGVMAVKLIHQALIAHWQIILEEPRPTFLTWVAAYILCLLPRLYSRIESVAVTKQKSQVLES